MNKRRKVPVAPYAVVSPAFCPGAEATQSGFIVFNDSRVHQVNHLESGLTRVVTYFPNGARHIKTYFAGLVALENQSAGIVHKPRSDLTPLLMLSTGATFTFSLDVSYRDQPPAVEHIQLTVEKRKTQKFGPCQFEVLEIECRMAFDDQAMQFTHVAVYSPLLRYVLAMRFAKHGTATAVPQFAPLHSRDRLLAHIRKEHAQDA